jgi:hypothetical protein
LKVNIGFWRWWRLVGVKHIPGNTRQHGNQGSTPLPLNRFSFKHQGSCSSLLSQQIVLLYTPQTT